MYQHVSSHVSVNVFWHMLTHWTKMFKIPHCCGSWHDLDGEKPGKTAERTNIQMGDWKIPACKQTYVESPPFVDHYPVASLWGNRTFALPKPMLTCCFFWSCRRFHCTKEVSIARGTIRMYGLWSPQVKVDKPGMVYDNMIGCSTLVCVIYIYIYTIYMCFGSSRFIQQWSHFFRSHLLSFYPC